MSARTAETLISIGDIRDTVIWFISLTGIAAGVWLAIKAIASRGRPFARRAFERLDPTVQGMRVWVLHAPVVFTYMAIWIVTSVIQQGTPESLADVMARSNSTNIYSLATEPIRVLFASAFIVADYAAFLIGYIVVYVLIAARLEHRVGSARFLMIAAVSHVIGSLLTVSVEQWAIAEGRVPATIAFTQDVGVSYVMVGSMGAYLWLVGTTWRLPYALACFAGVGLPVLLSRSIWDLGHFFAFSLGTLAGFAATRLPLREPLVWKRLVGAATPRRLPTFGTREFDVPSAAVRGSSD